MKYIFTSIRFSQYGFKTYTIVHQNSRCIYNFIIEWSM